MKNILSRLYRTYLNPGLDFRVRLFNVLAAGGLFISFLMAVFGVIAGNIIVTLINLAVSALSFALLTVSQRTGRYRLCYTITIFVIFICLFPALFFSSGGYHSGMPSFFVFAVVFTIFMLEGKSAVILSVTETALYISICIVAYLRPETVIFFDSELDFIVDVIVAFVAVSAALGICMFLHFRLYNEQQRKLDAQNIILDEQNTLLSRTNRAKTEFLANASHEMRTPLTVISVNVQTVVDILEDMGEAVKDPAAAELLTDAQSEIMRLSRMVSGMLTLASFSENTEKNKTDLSSLLQSTADMLRLLLSKRSNGLQTETGDGFTVFGDADLLSQVVLNLIQNANAHTQNDIISLRAVRDGAYIKTTVSDNGSGISPELLPRVFERGVSDENGTGFGLYLCKMVVESHGGEIWIESEPGKGASAHFTLPVYEGQYSGGDTK